MYGQFKGESWGVREIEIGQTIFHLRGSWEVRAILDWTRLDSRQVLLYLCSPFEASKRKTSGSDNLRAARGTFFQASCSPRLISFRA